jgi:hypothetical protein
MKKTWCTGSELIKVWNVSEENIKEFMAKGLLKPYKNLGNKNVLDAMYDLPNKNKPLSKIMADVYALPLPSIKLFGRHSFFKTGLKEEVGQLLFDSKEANELAIEHGLPPLWPPEEGEQIEEQQIQTLQGIQAHDSGNYFIHEGGIWHIGFKGEKGAIADHKYIKYIAYILQGNGNDVKCREMVSAVNLVGGASMSAKEADNQGLHQNNIVKDKEVSVKVQQELVKLLQEKESETDPLIREEIEHDINRIKNKIMKMNSNKLDRLPGNHLDNPASKKAQDLVRFGLKSGYAAFRKAGLKNLATHLERHIKPSGSYDFRYTDTDSKWEIKL